MFDQRRSNCDEWRVEGSVRLRGLLQWALVVVGCREAEKQQGSDSWGTGVSSSRRPCGIRSHGLDPLGRGLSDRWIMLPNGVVWGRGVDLGARS